ncbi:hypothetical protein N7U66_08345 [Lacinutrix neustonica]|uniref:Zn-dependent hydrolase n=1 Tax=Lacinutrix neustonica TaxID=2980107 RepID=A0A9E8SFJ4_9FLAO|nr:hypothetical protein [Lacinutrix neustonica]WAC03484.1 hypothetical protein N7U66_08345 [Lacinutrix neustonica]
MKNTIYLLVFVCIFSCKEDVQETETTTTETPKSEMQSNLDKYVSVKLTSDLSALSDKEKEMLPILMEAANKMNDLFWYEAYGDCDALLNSISDETTKTYVKINYGPWDRLNNNKPFIDGVGEKPKGANFYPKDMSKEEFGSATLDNKSSIYNFVRRDGAGKLFTIPYYKKFEVEVKQVSDLLLKAAELAEDKGLKTYLELRAAALLNDDYREK